MAIIEMHSQIGLLRLIKKLNTLTFGKTPAQTWLSHAKLYMLMVYNIKQYLLGYYINLKLAVVDHFHSDSNLTVLADIALSPPVCDYRKAFRNTSLHYC